MIRSVARFLRNSWVSCTHVFCFWSQAVSRLMLLSVHICERYMHGRIRGWTLDMGDMSPTFWSGGDVLCFVPLLILGQTFLVLMHTVFIGWLEKFSLN